MWAREWWAWRWSNIISSIYVPLSTWHREGDDIFVWCTSNYLELPSASANPLFLLYFNLRKVSILITCNDNKMVITVDNDHSKNCGANPWCPTIRDFRALVYWCIMYQELYERHDTRLCLKNLTGGNICFYCINWWMAGPCERFRKFIFILTIHGITILGRYYPTWLYTPSHFTLGMKILHKSEGVVEMCFGIILLLFMVSAYFCQIMDCFTGERELLYHSRKNHNYWININVHWPTGTPAHMNLQKKRTRCIE